MMKVRSMLAALALAVAPVAVLAAPASAAYGGSGSQASQPAGWGDDFRAWMCRTYGKYCD